MTRFMVLAMAVALVATTFAVPSPWSTVGASKASSRGLNERCHPGQRDCVDGSGPCTKFSL